MKRAFSDTMGPVSVPESSRSMFKRSFMLVVMIVLLVFVSAFASQMWVTRDLPSSFDPGLSIDTAFKTSKVPLLIEFYSDDCATCRRVAPMVHELKDTLYKDKLTVVMLDVTDPANRDIAQLFGVDTLPGLYVFDHRRMKKFQIKSQDFASKGTLQQAIDEALAKSFLRMKA